MNKDIEPNTNHVFNITLSLTHSRRCAVNIKAISHKSGLTIEAVRRHLKLCKELGLADWWEPRDLASKKKGKKST